MKRPLPSRASNPRRKTTRLTRRRNAIAGIGASAGGLEAFTELLHKLPVDTDIAFVFVQHLDPKHESMLPELLARATSMPVRPIKNGMTTEANHVYVIQPNTTVTISDGVLKVARRAEVAGHHMPIDVFFRSLAADQKAGSIGILLSGSASDGVLGLGAIKAEGGVTFAQDPQTAKFEAMPQSAIAAGSVDFVLPAGNIPRELIRVTGHPYLSQSRSATGGESSRDDDARSLNEIFAILQRSKRTDFSHYRRSTIERRIARRMAVHAIDSRQKFVEYLRRHPDAAEALFQDLLINVTSFFREPEKYQFLSRRIIPKLLKRTPSKEGLRLWIPGCSTGEEVYSIAICLLEAIEKTDANTSFQIFGTDLSDKAVERAREGKYALSVETDVGSARLERFFTKRRDGYQISKRVRDLCLFASHDLTADPPFSSIDLISCCNVLIYMSPVIQRRILKLFHYALKPEGFLVLGKAETIAPLSDGFSRLDRKQPIYSRMSLAEDIPIDFGTTREYSGAAHRSTSPVSLEFPVTPDVHKEADRIVLDRYQPPGFTIDEHFKIIKFRGNTVPYLDPSRHEEASLSLLKMVRPSLAMELRAAVNHAKKKNIPVRREGLTIVDSDTGTVNVEVIPIVLASHATRHFLVLITPTPVKVLPVAEGTRGKGADLTTLKRELASTKAYLHSVIEGQEATNEELKSVSEEIQARNEELQSSIEELETTKEELQAANEELTTLNETLRSRNAELGNVNSQLAASLQEAGEARKYAEAIVHTTGQPLMVLRSNLQVLTANRAFYDLFQVTPEETENRFIFDLGNKQWNIPELRRLLQEILPRQTEIRNFPVAATFERTGFRSLLLHARRLETARATDRSILLSIEDLTDHEIAERERKKLARAEVAQAEAEAANRAKDLFLGIVSHELRTPLAVIVGWTRALRTGEVDNERRKMVMEALDRNARTLAQLVEDLLDVSRIVSGTLRLSLTTTDLEPITQSVLDDFQVTADEKNIAMNLDAPPGGSLIRGDAARLQQIVRNLLSNAIKFAPKDGHVNVRLESIGSHIRLSVTDTGPGISPHFLPYIFNPFRQSDRPTVQARQGLGLGLAIVKNLVELHGGTIRAENAESGGARFVVDLPAASPSLSGMESRYREGNIPRLDGLTILFVDDHDDTRTMVAQLLSQSGAGVILANSVSQAMLEMQQRVPDVLLSDISMNGEDGYDLIRQVRALPEAAAAVPAVALTALVSDEEKARAFEAGFQEFVGKPVDRVKLLTILARVGRNGRLSK